MRPAAPNPGWWRDRRVLVTGHTGFVGGWLCAWLAKMGARVSGFALPPPTTPSFFALTRLESVLDGSVTGDVRNAEGVARAIAASDPQVVFHLAAQPIVRDAFREPLATFATNVMGTVNVLEACRRQGALERLIVYTTDKVYRNEEAGRPFAEEDPLGGKEPYSASKAAADWAVASYRDSYFRGASMATSLATVRAGNIVGGGDWGRDRLLPDAIRAFGAGVALAIRNPGSTRPWQHVLDVVRGTLLLAERAPASDEPGESIGWNFGPPAGDARSVAELSTLAVQAWGGAAAWRHEADGSIPESRTLALSSERAGRSLGWRCAWTLERTVRASVDWYRAALEGRGDLLDLTRRQIDDHLADVSAGRA